MKILYVTSFNQLLFTNSGQLLLSSYLLQKIEGDLLVCYEDFDFESFLAQEAVAKVLESTSQKIFHTNISKYPFMIKWLEDNKAYIPICFGGTMPPINTKATPQQTPYQKKANQYWNRKASLWFRKVASLKFACDTYGDQYDAIIWVDSDCVFYKHLPGSDVKAILGDNQVFFHQGNIRNQHDYGFESGFIGFTKGKGYNIIQTVAKFYTKQKYLKQKRWDDGYIFRIIIYHQMKDKELDAIDLVDNNMGGKRYEAIGKGPFRHYLIHNKGKHKKLKGLGSK